MRTSALFSLLLTMAACSGPKEPATPYVPPAPSAPATAGDPAADAKQIFAMRCTPCHGPEGRGDGQASASLTPKPRNFHDTVWQKSVNDEHIETIIKVGGAGVGKSPSMPANPDLNDKPAVVTELKKLVRSFGEQG